MSGPKTDLKDALQQSGGKLPPSEPEVKEKRTAPYRSSTESLACREKTRDRVLWQGSTSAVENLGGGAGHNDSGPARRCFERLICKTR